LKITTRHIAAVQFAITGVFLIAIWWLLLEPFERTVAQLKFIFAPGYENRAFFIWLAVASVTTGVLAIAFCSRRAENFAFAASLTFCSALLFVLSLWQFDNSLIYSYGAGLGLSIWSLIRPHYTPFSRAT
jgi:hypothetical protein